MNKGGLPTALCGIAEKHVISLLTRSPIIAACTPLVVHTLHSIDAPCMVSSAAPCHCMPKCHSRHQTLFLSDDQLLYAPVLVTVKTNNITSARRNPAYHRCQVHWCEVLVNDKQRTHTGGTAMVRLRSRSHTHSACCNYRATFETSQLHLIHHRPGRTCHLGGTAES